MALLVEPLDSTTFHNPAAPRDHTDSTPSASGPAANRGSITGSARYLLPSIADLLFILLFIGLGYGALASRLLDDAGIGWHIRNGQNIVATHAIPHTDPF